MKKKVLSIFNEQGYYLANGLFSQRAVSYLEKEFDKIILNSKLEAKNLFNEARQKVLDDIDKKRSELEKNLEEEIEIAEKEIQNLNKSSAENIKKIATETSSGLIKQLIGEEINKENISSIVNDLTDNSKENRKNV